jgi:predicted esterase
MSTKQNNIQTRFHRQLTYKPQLVSGQTIRKVFLKALMIIILLFPPHIADAQNSKSKGRITMIEQVRKRLSECEASAKEPLLKDHFRSLRILFEQCQVYGTVTGADSIANKEIDECGAAILADLKGPGTKWETYLAGRPLVSFAPNMQEQSVQPYAMSLPAGYKSGNSYPLIVMLHGGVTGITPLRYVMYMMEFPVMPGANVRHKSNAKQSYLMVWPYLRGNSRIDTYTDMDISMLIDHMHKRTNVDLDRVYCAGFSLGAMNTWTEAFCSPDRWAAILVFHGAIGIPTTSMPVASNAAHLPFRLATGENDKISVEHTKLMTEFLSRAGIKPEVEIRPGVAHEVIGLEENIDWLLQFKRIRPSTFSYTEFLDGFNGTRGITMGGIQGDAGFKCTIEGSKITLEVKGCKTISVDPSNPGLNIKGETTVIINGTMNRITPPFPKRPQSFTIHETNTTTLK